MLSFGDWAASPALTRATKTYFGGAAARSIGISVRSLLQGVPERRMPSSRVVARAVASMILFTLGATAPLARAEGEEQPGKQLYLRYCGACHGPQAKGDGIAAAFMRPSPPDLTLLAPRHGGAFPMEQVVKTIDGREMLRAHGSPAMPVWGQILSEELGSKGKQRPAVERRVQERIFSIAEYLQAIQVK